MTPSDTCLRIASAAENPTRLRLLGRNVLAGVRVNDYEIARREAAGTGALCDIALLQVLVTLPAWEPLSWSLLNRREQRVLRDAPPGVLERSGGTVTRLAVPSATVEDVTVEARSGTAGLLAASAFAPYCRRTALIPAGEADDATTLLDGNLYGIGIAVQSGGQRQQILEPAPFVQRRWTWASWLLHEQAWSQMCQPLAVTAA